MNIINIIKNMKSNERGVALIFTLGILALLLILALSFASSSMLERKAALYSNNASGARIIAQAGLNRAIAAMSMYMTISDNFDIIKSMDTTSDNGETYDFLYRLNTDSDGVVYNIDMDNYDATDNGSIHWNYIYNTDPSSTSSDKKIIGRFAYVILPAGGRLDPSACVDTGKNEASSSTVGDSSYEPRVGKNVYEIYLGGLEQPLGTYLTSTEVEDMGYSSGSGDLTDGTRWADYSTLFTALGINSTGTDIIKRMKWQDEWLAVGTADAPEYEQRYWIDSDGDGKIDSGEKYQRFNLTRTDWDTGFGKGANSDDAAKLLIGNSSTTPKIYDSDPLNFDDDSGIEWLKNYSSLPNATFADSPTRAKQICANLIDYCDTDSIPTSDVAAGSWGTTAPSYTGNEKTPYINEFAISLESSIQTTKDDYNDTAPDPNAENDYKVECAVDISALAEAINIYSDSFSADMKMIPYASSGGSLTIYVDFKVGGTTTTESFDFTTYMNNNMGSFTGRYSTYSPTAHTVTHTEYVYDASNAPTVNVSIRIPTMNLVLNYDSNNVDCAKLVACSSPIKFSDGATTVHTFSSTGLATPMESLITWEVNDPRQNLNSGDWTLTDGTATSTTIGAQNSVVTASSSGDSESIAGSGALVSTAYIRNAVMKSPWELGCIHRGAKWETINLKQYNTAGTASLGIGTYANGDANIFDQIKMTSDTKTYGLVNMKTSNEDVLRALFMGIYVNDDYANVDATSSISGNAISSSNANDLATKIKSYIVTNSPINRGEIANAAGIDDASVMTSQTNDAKKEAIIGKMINLTRLAKADIFKIIVLSQSINDTGGPYSTTITDGIKLRKDFNMDGDTDDTLGSGDTSALEKVGYRDPVNSKNFSTLPAITEAYSACQKGRFEPGFDEIVGEQKIVATVKYDSVNSKWITLKYELISE